jgi:hypothetical protein
MMTFWKIRHPDDVLKIVCVAELAIMTVVLTVAFLFT